MYKTIEDINKGYKKKDFKPTELVSEYLSKIKLKDQKLNSYTEVFEDLVLSHAQNLDKEIDLNKSILDSNILFGVPIALKDIFLVKDSICTAGSKMLENYVSNYDSKVYESLQKTSCLLLGKNNMDEFAMGSSTETSYYGSTLNPWDLNKVPGGSSGGSASAVAAGLACASIGTDTGGSIRQPASFCGIVGLKPSYGRVSRFGMIAFSSSLDQAGPLCRTVKDSAILLDSISGYDPKDSTSLNLPPTNCYIELCKNDFHLKDFTIGIPSKLLDKGLDEEIKANFDSIVKELLSNGVKVVDIDLPNAKYSVATYYIIAPCEASSNLSRFDGVRYGHSSNEKNIKDLEEFYIKNRSEGFGDEVKRRIMLGNYALSSGYYDAYYLKANKVKEMIVSDFTSAFNDVDCILSPTCPELPFSLGEKKNDPLKMYLSDILTIPANLAQLPSISIPLSLSKNGLPIGIQITGKKLDENTLLKVADSLENLIGFSAIPKD